MESNKTDLSTQLAATGLPSGAEQPSQAPADETTGAAGAPVVQETSTQTGAASETPVIDTSAQTPVTERGMTSSFQIMDESGVIEKEPKQQAQAEQATGSLGAADTTQQGPVAEDLGAAAQAAPTSDTPVAQDPVIEAAATTDLQILQGTAQDNESFEPEINEVLSQVGPAAKLALFSLNAYMQEMAPGRTMSESTGATLQANLYRTLLAIVQQLSEEDFAVVFPVLLQLFVKHADGVFHELYVFRFTETLRLSSDDRTTFLRMLNLLKLLADPKSRQVAIRQITPARAFGPSISDEGRMRVMSFFNL